MGKADLHIHTDQGDGVDSVEAILDYVERETDLHVIAITEHDRLETSLEARDVWSRGRYSFDFVTGVEVTTEQGHVVALFVEETLESLQPVEETVAAVRRQGGACFVPHPTSKLARSLDRRAFARVAAAGLRFDGIELASANPTTWLYMGAAERLNQAYALPVVGASDAHFKQAIGSAWTVFDGTSAADLRRAFASGSVSGEAGRFPSLRSVGLRRAARVPLNAIAGTPRRLGWRRTTRSFLRRNRL